MIFAERMKKMKRRHLHNYLVVLMAGRHIRHLGDGAGVGVDDVTEPFWRGEGPDRRSELGCAVASTDLGRVLQKDWEPRKQETQEFYRDLAMRWERAIDQL